MITPTLMLYPSAPLQVTGSEERLEKKLNNVKSFNNSIKNVEELNTYFNEQNHISNKKNKNHKTLTSILKTVNRYIRYY